MSETKNKAARPRWGNFSHPLPVVMQFWPTCTIARYDCDNEPVEDVFSSMQSCGGYDEFEELEDEILKAILARVNAKMEKEECPHGSLTMWQFIDILHQPQMYPLQLCQWIAEESCSEAPFPPSENMIPKMFGAYNAYLSRMALREGEAPYMREVDDGLVEVAVLYDPSPNTPLKCLPTSHQWLRSDRRLVEAYMFGREEAVSSMGLSEFIPSLKELEVGWVPKGKVVLVEYSKVGGEQVRFLDLPEHRPFIA